MTNYSYTINPNKVIIGKKELAEGTILKRKFADGTQDTYDCKLIFKEVIVDENTQQRHEMKPFTIRVGCPDWIMEFISEEYELENGEN